MPARSACSGRARATRAGYPRAMTVSALTGAGLPEAWAAVEALAEARVAERRLGGAAAGAGRGLVRPCAGDRADRAADRRPGHGARRRALAARVAAGEIAPDAAAESLLAAIFGTG